MPDSSGSTVSAWLDQQHPIHRKPLDSDATAEVCVIGAGIAGMCVAYMLGRQGASVIVLDDGPIGGGETGRTTAHLSNAFDDRYFEVERLRGSEAARIIAQSHGSAIDSIDQIAASEGIDCDFQRLDGYLFLAEGQQPQLLSQELEAAVRAGAQAELVSQAPVAALGSALRFARQGQFHPMKYLAGLTGATERRGGRIYTGTRAVRMDGGADACVHTSTGVRVRCGAIVVATNTPVNDAVAIHTKQAPYRTFVIAASISRGAVSNALYWDVGWPYHYVRLQAGSDDHDLLIVGGEDHKTGQADDGQQRFARLEQWARERFPAMGTVRYRWSGQVMEPVDGVAFIGRNPMDHDNVYIVTGDSGQGMTHGTIGGMLLADLIAGRSNPWAELYDPSRKTLKAIRDWASENLNVARQYGDYLTSGDVDSRQQIAAGQGAVLRRGLSKIAVYRDDSGQLHERSAVCPHMKCVVHWNSLEKSWDCPCHGSRFSAEGEAVNGPANQDLPAAPAAKQQAASL